MKPMGARNWEGKAAGSHACGTRIEERGEEHWVMANVDLESVRRPTADCLYQG